MNANASLPLLNNWLRSLPFIRDGFIVFSLQRRLMMRRGVAGNAGLIHSAGASVMAPEPSVCNAVPAPAAISLAVGEVLSLSSGQRMAVVSGRLWLTHDGDSRDFFPGPRSVVTGGERSVIEALSPAVLQPK